MGLQKILKPTKYRAVDTSGNNNHGQIYSGRGLEFDGVSDYLDTGMAFSETNCTVAVWAYIDDLGAGADIICARDSDDEGIVIRANSAEQILFKVGDGSTTNTITSSRSYKNTWIRIVGTYDGSTQRLYINGVEAGSASISITIPSVTSDVFIGARSFTSQINMFSGKLSDVQLWNATWSASDALYDYLNPESLALNNGGTSLTESNLKLWYPMQDGHRGSDGVNDGKHFIMDGANTGLGDDIVNWTSTFSGTGITTDGNVGSWVSNAGDSGDTHTYIDNDNKTIRLKSDDGAHVHLKILNSLTPGVAYKFVVTVDSISGKFRIRPGDNEPDADMTTTGTHSFYFASSESTYWRIERDSGVGDMTVSDIKIYPINEKHHATSEFFDELVTEGDFSNGGAAWSTSGSTITTAINGGAFVSTGDADGGFGTCSQSETLIEGRTYKLEFEVTAITGTPSVHNYCGALTKSLGTASVTTFTDTFVASSSDATAGGIDVRTICANGESVTIDNISFKEVFGYDYYNAPTYKFGIVSSVYDQSTGAMKTSGVAGDEVDVTVQGECTLRKSGTYNTVAGYDISQITASGDAIDRGDDLAKPNQVGVIAETNANESATQPIILFQGVEFSEHFVHKNSLQVMAKCSETITKFRPVSLYLDSNGDLLCRHDDIPAELPDADTDHTGVDPGKWGVAELGGVSGDIIPVTVAGKTHINTSQNRTAGGIITRVRENGTMSGESTNNNAVPNAIGTVMESGTGDVPITIFGGTPIGTITDWKRTIKVTAKANGAITQYCPVSLYLDANGNYKCISDDIPNTNTSFDNGIWCDFRKWGVAQETVADGENVEIIVQGRTNVVDARDNVDRGEFVRRISSDGTVSGIDGIGYALSSLGIVEKESRINDGAYGVIIIF